MSVSDLLLWARGPGFDVAVAVFVFGMVYRVVEVVGLGRKAQLAPARGSAAAGGVRTVFSRSVPDAGTWRRAMFTIVAGYGFHVGLFVIIFALSPHIRIFESVLGVGWPALPTPVVDAVAVVTLITLIAVLVHRIRHPVLRFLSTPGDYLAWLVTFLPVLTGYLAYHHALLPYTAMLALHILSVELLLVLLPFSKLAHMITFAISRWYNGAMAGYKGVRA